MPLIRTDRIKRFAALGDTHAPFTDKDAWAWAVKVIREYKPHVIIHMGDWIDTDPVNPHEDPALTKHNHTQRTEYEEAARQSHELRGCLSGRGTLVRLVGNHEDRLEVHAGTISPRIRDLVHWSNHKGLSSEWRKWKEVPYIKGIEGTFRLGNVVFYHGWDISTSADELEAIQMAMAHGGTPDLLCLRGHTHSPLVATQTTRTRKIKLPWWYMNTGHLGPVKPDYTRRWDTSGWAHSVVLGECLEGGSGRTWDATLLKKGDSHGLRGPDLRTQGRLARGGR